MLVSVAYNFFLIPFHARELHYIFSILFFNYDSVCSTGATDDKITDIKKLLIIINEMALTKPQAIHSNLYTKRARTDGESIRDEALRSLSDSEPDDYIHGKYSSGDSCGGDSRKRPRNNEEIEYVTDLNGFFNDKPMTLEEEYLMDQELLREMYEAQGDVNTNVVVHAVDVDVNDNRESVDRSSNLVGDLPPQVLICSTKFLIFLSTFKNNFFLVCKYARR